MKSLAPKLLLSSYFGKISDRLDDQWVQIVGIEINEKFCYYLVMTLQNFIRKRPYLIWYVRDPQQLSESAIVESVLNYGDFDDVKKMISILGMHRVSRIFKRQLKQKRVNYDPKIANYFTLYFRRHA